MKKIIPLIAMLLCLLGIDAIAQNVPNAMSFKTIIRDAEGQPLVNQEVQIGLSLVNTTNDEILYQEIEQYETNELGIVCLDLGMSASTDLVNIPWWEGNIELLVEANVDSNSPSTFVTQLPLYAVPYAHTARWTTDSDFPVGAPGPTGATGATGAPGVNGAPGPQGITGPTGPPGINGGPGSVGPTGPTGPMNPIAGPAGPMGPNGPTGYAGPAGPAGPPGPPGQVGISPPWDCFGPTGPPGINEPNWPFMNGYVYPLNFNKDIVLTAPNGTCWQLQITDGAISTTSVQCP